MFINSRLGLFLLVPLLCARQVSTRQYHFPTFPDDHKVKIGGSTESVSPADTSDQSDYPNARSYPDEPLAQLVERLPELKTLQPAADQQELPAILQTMSRRVDDFVREIGDLIAHEDVTQEKLDPNGKIEARERVQDEI